MALQVEGAGEGGDQAVGDAGCFLRLLHLALDHGELVAAEPGEGVGLAQFRLQPGGDGAEQRIAGRVAERVVDFLETIEVDQQHGEALAARHPRQRRLQPVAE
nr:hypothetical protein [Rhodovastum atsumiense]